MGEGRGKFRAPARGPGFDLIGEARTTRALPGGDLGWGNSQAREEEQWLDGVGWGEELGGFGSR